MARTRLSVTFDVSNAWEEWVIDVDDDNPPNLELMTDTQRVDYFNNAHANGMIEFVDLTDSGNGSMTATKVELLP